MIETNDGVGVVDSVSTDASVDTAPIPVATEDQTTTVAESNTPVELESNDEIDVEQEAAVDKVIADAEAEAAKDNSSLAKHLRKVIASKEAEIKNLSSRTLTDSDQEAIELYKGLTSFDNETNTPSARLFAEKLVQKDVKVAYQAGVDIFNQPVPDDPNGWNLGHHYLKANGVDPNRLDEVRAFLQGDQKVSFSQIPEFVPKELGDAYKGLSEKAREYLDFQLESDDQTDRQAAIEHLQNAQYRIDQRTNQEEQQRQTQARTIQEINQEVDAQTVDTFNEFIDTFRATPTFTNAKVSSDPVVDSAYKNVINLAALNLAEPGSVAGKQAIQFFKELGVNVDPAKIQEAITMVTGSIETSVKAGKFNYTSNQAEALKTKAIGLRMLSGLRNSIFAQAVKRMAEVQKGASEEESNTVMNNAGLPTFNSSQSIENGQQKMSTQDIVKALAEKARS